MKITDRPDNAQECARERCGHSFGEHYVTNNGKDYGCSQEFDDQKDGYTHCQCDGFLISYTYPVGASR